MNITIYLHSNKETNRAAGEKAGLTGAALDFFLFAGYEHKMTYWVSPTTGRVTLTAVDDHPVQFGATKK